jgi:hypothetical protein
LVLKNAANRTRLYRYLESASADEANPGQSFFKFSTWLLIRFQLGRPSGKQFCCRHFLVAKFASTSASEVESSPEILLKRTLEKSPPKETLKGPRKKLQGKHSAELALNYLL